MLGSRVHLRHLPRRHQAVPGRRSSPGHARGLLGVRRVMRGRSRLRRHLRAGDEAQDVPADPGRAERRRAREGRLRGGRAAQAYGVNGHQRGSTGRVGNQSNLNANLTLYHPAFVPKISMNDVLLMLNFSRGRKETSC